MSATTSHQQHPETLAFFFEGKPLNIPTEFIMKQHPGGKAVILPFVGRDLAEAFTDAAHSFDAQEMVEEYIAQSSKSTSAEEKAAMAARKSKRDEEMDTWRWRSTAIAFSVAAIVGAYVLRPSS